MGDGSVRFMSSSTDWRTLKSLACSSDGFVVANDQ
jgi:hypothetical protein